MAQYQDAGGPGAWPIGVSVITCFAVAVMAVYRGERHITRSDWVALVCALGALPLWFLTHDPLGAVIILTCVAGVGFYPTYRKSFYEPHQESAGWTLNSAFAYMLSIMALTHYDWVTLIYPVVMVGLQLGLGVMILGWRVVGKREN